MEREVRQRGWLQRFTRSFLGYRRHLGIITALRAAWIVSTGPPSFDTEPGRAGAKSADSGRKPTG